MNKRWLGNAGPLGDSTSEAWYVVRGPESVNRIFGRKETATFLLDIVRKTF